MIFIRLTWTYLFFSKYFKERDCSQSIWSQKWRWVPPILAFSNWWYILSGYQLNHMWSSTYFLLFEDINFQFWFWNNVVSIQLFHVQCKFFPIIPAGCITEMICVSIYFLEFALCLFFSATDFTWLLIIFMIGLFLMFVSNIFCSFKRIFFWFISIPTLLYYLQSYWISNCRYQNNYIGLHDSMFVFITKKKASDRVAIDHCYEEFSQNKNINRISFFTKTSESVYVDNCANTHITNNCNHFIDLTPL